MEKIVIIGNGISGVTAARFIRKNSDKEIIIISSESKYFFSRTALMYIFMGHMKFENTMPYEKGFYKKNRLDLVFDRVESINFKEQTLSMKEGDLISYDKLILAVGSKPNKFGWKGEDLDGVQGLYSYQDLEKLEADKDRINSAVIIGGGLIGVELAEMLHYRKKKVTILVRGPRFWENILGKEEALMIGNHIESHGIKIQINTELDEIIDDGNGGVKGIRTKDGQEIECEFVGLTAGVSPNIDFLKNTELAIKRGISVNRKFETNIPNVYAIGDCAEIQNPIKGRRGLEQVWYTGKMMGETLGTNIGSGNEVEYNPGHWYNSAKFFDIEYQTYGVVPSVINENTQKEFIWEENNKLIRIVFEKETNLFLGINNYGIRLRHELFDKWLREKATVQEVLRNLKSANFDPEFFKKYEKEIIKKFNKDFNENIELTNKKWYQILAK